MAASYKEAHYVLPDQVSTGPAFSNDGIDLLVLHLL